MRHSICHFCLQLLINQNQQQMQSVLNDKENQVPTIVLDFKKKNKSKPNSERTNSSSSLLKSPNAKIVSNNTIVLLQKKRQYSESLREKNSQKEGKKSRHSQTLQEKIKNQIQKFEGEALKLSNIYNSDFYTTKTQNDSDCKQNSRSITLVSLAPKKEQKSKLRDAKRQKSKLQQTSMLVEDIKSHNFNPNFSMLSISENFPQQSMMNPDVSVIERINEISRIQRRSQICSRQVDQSYGPYQSEQTKEIELIKKQNNTFKKELANFRRQNAALKRQAEELKKKLAVFTERNQYLQNQSTQQFKMIESLQSKVSQSLQKVTVIEKKTFQRISIEGNQNQVKLKEIIANYENELFQATNLNKKLQFRNYILEKRLMDEGEIHKKQMAKQISVWKQRYIKARNQNLRLKDSRGSSLFQMSISQEM